jgi:ribonuclease HI
MMEYHLYTDGSYAQYERMGGWSFVGVDFIKNTFQYSIHKAGLAAIAHLPHATDEIELHAIYQAIKWALPGSEVNIYTDSAHAISIIQHKMYSWRVVNLIHGLIDDTSGRRKLNLIKIPRNSDIYAEYADYLAKERRKGTFLRNFVVFKGLRAEKMEF